MENFEIKNISSKELEARIELNYSRLTDDPYYQMPDVFSPDDYDWYGDKEGRALLSFVSHYKINKNEAPCMRQLFLALPSKFNDGGYLGPMYDGIAHEQQLSGHSWLLRGLCEYYEQFADEKALKMIEDISFNLFIPSMKHLNDYPLERNNQPDGDVSGTSMYLINGWSLSTDVGCAFMSIDGLSHAYKVTKNEKIKDLVTEMIRKFLSIDLVKLQAQTHCSLTAARGMIRMYYETKDNYFLEGAKKIFNTYIEDHGITYTYQNANWWGRNNTWTEPCAIVDSLMVALELYKISKNEEYRIIAARIYHNGLSTSQRSNGGAGTDTVVTTLEGGVNFLQAQMYEAYFCCTMRLSEGLWYINDNKDLLYARVTGKLEKVDHVYYNGDIIYALVDEKGKEYIEDELTVDGYKLSPIIKYYKVKPELIPEIKQQIIF